MRLLGSALQIVGLGLAVVAFWLVAPLVGVLAASGAVFAVGFQLERLHT